MAYVSLGKRFSAILVLVVLPLAGCGDEEPDGAVTMEPVERAMKRSGQAGASQELDGVTAAISQESARATWVVYTMPG